MADKTITTQITVLVLIAILMTISVYSLVAGIVKIDDGALLVFSSLAVSKVSEGCELRSN